MFCFDWNGGHFKGENSFLMLFGVFKACLIHVFCFSKQSGKKAKKSVGEAEAYDGVQKAIAPGAER